MAVVNINGLKLGYERRGRGEHLVLISGLGFGRWLWERQLDVFSREFTVVTMDNRGVGESGAPEGPYSVSQMAKDVKALLDKLQIERAHILGVSLGGFIAQVLALDFPNMVDRLILVSTTMGGEKSIFAAQRDQEALNTAQQEVDLKERTRKTLQLTLGEKHSTGDCALLEELTEKYLAHRPSPQAYLAQAQAGIEFWLQKHRASDLHRLKNKTLVLTGDSDRIVPPENGEVLVDFIQRSRRVIIPEAGHLLMWEAVATFNKEVLSFLEEEG